MDDAKNPATGDVAASDNNQQTANVDSGEAQSGDVGKKSLHLQLVKSDAGGVDNAAPPPKPTRTWKTKLLKLGTSKTTSYIKVLANAMVPLREAPQFKDALRYDASALAVILERCPPWETESENWQPRKWTDQDDRLYAEWLQKEAIYVESHRANEGVQAVARERSFHPIREFLNELTWDGKARVDRWIHTYLGAEDNKYHMIIGSKWLISGVARIMQPGCKADCVLQLEGSQGIGKGQALAALAVNPQWFSDDIRDIGGREAAMGLAGKWIVEFAELTALQGKGAEAKKAFISRTIDRYRPPWGRTTGDFPRQCIFAASTNRYENLDDATGNRRFWPVRCNSPDIVGLTRDCRQLWAEARARYEAGEKWWLVSSEERLLTAEEQEKRFDSDALEEQLIDFLAMRKEVTITQIWEDALEKEELIGRRDQLRISEILRHLGWERTQKIDKTGRQMRVFIPPNRT